MQIADPNARLPAQSQQASGDVRTVDAGQSKTVASNASSSAQTVSATVTPAQVRLQVLAEINRLLESQDLSQEVVNLGKALRGSSTREANGEEGAESTEELLLRLQRLLASSTATQSSSSSLQSSDVQARLLQLLATLQTGKSSDAPKDMAKVLLSYLENNDFDGFAKQLSIFSENQAPSQTASRQSVVYAQSSQTVSTAFAAADPSLRLLFASKELLAYGTPGSISKAQLTQLESDLQNVLASPVDANTAALLGKEQEAVARSSKPSMESSWIPVLRQVLQGSTDGALASQAGIGAPGDTTSQVRTSSAGTSTTASSDLNSEPWSRLAATVIQANKEQLEVALPSGQSLRLATPSWGKEMQALNRGDSVELEWKATDKGGLVLLNPMAASLPQALVQDLQKQGTPITPNLVETQSYLDSLPEAPQSAALVRDLTALSHAASLQSPSLQGQTAEAMEPPSFWLRTLLAFDNRAPSASQLQSLLQYRSEADPEKALLEKLPTALREAFTRQLGQGQLLRPEDMESALRKALNEWKGSAEKISEDVLRTADNLLKHWQNTRLDQETRHPSERQEVLYFMQGQDLQKGRLQVKDEREEKGGNRKRSEAGFGFSLDTQTPRLGKVRVEFDLKGARVDLLVLESSGLARPAMEAERESLREELAQLGWSLERLGHGLLQDDGTQAIQAPGSTPTQTVAPGQRPRLDLRI